MKSSRPGNRTLVTGIQNTALSIAAILLTLLALEAAARLYVNARWTEQEVDSLTQDFSARSGYISDPDTGYRLEPNRYRKDSKERAFSHNSLGLRGPEIESSKPADTYRIVLMGASTIYGPHVDDNLTSAAQLQRLLTQEKRSSLAIEVINAGVPGWTSRETAINLRKNILALDPDMIVVMDGRNELFAQLFNNYRDDYSHYRPLGFDFTQSNATHRKVFRVSRLAMLMSTARAGDGRFGFSQRASQPAYGYVRWENKPVTREIILAAQDASRRNGFRKNLEQIITIAKSNGVSVALASIPFLAEHFVSGVIPRDPELLPSFSVVVQGNNQITREIAQAHALPFIDGASLSRPEFLIDDCHFIPEGEKQLAALIAAAIIPVIDKSD